MEKTRLDVVYDSPEFTAEKYSALYIEPVTLWHGEDMARESGLSLEDLELLATYFHDVLTKVPDGQKLALAAQPGPGVITVQAALTEVEASSPVYYVLTSVIPVGILLSAGKQALMVSSVQASMTVLRPAATWDSLPACSSHLSMVRCWSCRVCSFQSFLTWAFTSFSAWRWISSWPFLSSMRNSLNPRDWPSIPGADMDLKTVRVLFSGSGYGTGFAAL